MIRRGFGAAGGAVVTAAGAALCCAGPLVAVALGVSGAGIAGTFEPLRPYFIGATVLLLGAGHWSVRREERLACEPEKLCADPQTRRLLKWSVWTASLLAALLISFPIWSRLLF